MKPLAFGLTFEHDCIKKRRINDLRQHIVVKLAAVKNTVFLSEIIEEISYGIKTALDKRNFRKLVGACPYAGIGKPAVSLDHVGNFRKKLGINR